MSLQHNGYLEMNITEYSISVGNDGIGGEGKSEICLFNPFLYYIEYSLNIYLQTYGSGRYLLR